MNKNIPNSSLVVLLLLMVIIPSVNAEGQGEIRREGNYTLLMSYDEEIRQTHENQTTYLFDDTGNLYYLRETDTDISVNLTIDKEGNYITLIIQNKPNITRQQYKAIICYEEPITTLSRFQIPNNGTYCMQHMTAYQFNDITVNQTYRINNNKRVNSYLNIPFQWYIGKGAGGGGGCSCLPSTTNVVVSIASVASAYPLDTQDSTGRKVQYSGTPSGCSGAILETKYRPASTWLDVPLGTWHNWGSDTADTSGSNIKILNPVHNTAYWRPIDLQQVDTDVDFYINFNCPGSVYDGYSSAIIDSSIYHGYHYITTNFTNNSNHTAGTIPFSFYAEDESNHLLNITLYINGTANQTLTGIYYGSYTLNYTFNVTFTEGNYRMEAIVTDLSDYTNTTGIYYFTVQTTEEDDELHFFIISGILLMIGLGYFKTKKLK